MLNNILYFVAVLFFFIVVFSVLLRKIKFEYLPLLLVCVSAFCAFLFRQSLNPVLLFCFLTLFIFFQYYGLKCQNPYTTTFIFGKKGAGKSCLMVKEMLKYQKMGWHIYTDMPDVMIPGVRVVSLSDLALFRPEPNSVLFLDEVGVTMDNRQYKTFPPGLRDFFKYARKMKVKIFINSQSYDVDKKVRDCVDSMILQTCLFGFLSLSRPIEKRVTLTEPVGDSESKITDKLEFSSIFSWRVYFMPKYFKYFDSCSMPSRDFVKYHEIELPTASAPKIKARKSNSNIIYYIVKLGEKLDFRKLSIFAKKNSRISKNFLRIRDNLNSAGYNTNSDDGHAVNHPGGE